MRQLHVGGAAVLAALLLSTAAQAQVTAEEVWQNWKTVSASYGQTLTAGSEARSGDTLTISDLAIASTFEGGSATGTIASVNFRELGDGTVEITMSPEFPLTIEATDPEPDDAAAPETAVINLLIRQPGLTMIAGGSAAETRYDFTAPTLNVGVTEMTVDGAPVELVLDIALTALGGSYLFTAGETNRLESTLNAENVGLNLAFTDPETGGKASIKGDMAQLAGATTGTLLDMAQMADMSAALAAGFATEGAFTYGATAYDFDITEPEGTATGRAEIGSGSLNFAMDAGRMQYGGGAKDATFTLSGSQIPFPQITASYGEAAFNFLMPVAVSETPGDFALLTRIVDLTISDEIWGMLDPGAVLPRDPATLVIDTKGTARWLVDIMDPAMAETEQVPGELHSLDVTELTLRAVGAEVTGNGAFTFDNTDLTTFDGMPAPTGKLDLRIVGANGLLDKLVSMGLLPEDQAMGARMMMGLFAQVGEGEDTLTSTLEFRDKGFFANGQQLQ